MITIEQYDNAARAVVIALRETTGRRRHMRRYKAAAAPALGIKSIYPSRWAEVLAAGLRLGLFRVDRETLKHPILVDLGGPVDAGCITEYTSDEDPDDEDTSDDPTVESRPMFTPPPPPPRFICSVCSRPARVHWAAPVPECDEDFYVDADGYWKCHTCAVVSFSESWGGVERFAGENGAWLNRSLSGGA